VSIAVKICGLTDAAALEASVSGGARFGGLVFYEASPRHLGIFAAGDLARRAPPGFRLVGLFVDPDNETLDRHLGELPLDYVQLHGAESPERCLEVAELFSIPVIKALKIGAAPDLRQIGLYRDSAEILLLDAKPPPGLAVLPGGTGLAFDWTLLSGREIAGPWMLAGGLTPETLASALSATGAPMVDVSSGVESRPGVKDPSKIARFLEVAGRFSLDS
jgi:phosphoribosylanthranilate isomerase